MFTGKLYLIPVPIGNLKDITIRALDMLADVDYILAEDTRISKVLLSAYEIDTQLISYHQHNERSRVAQIVEYLDKGKNLGLITDAGMPCISDPGAIIVAELIALDYEVVALPGANAALTCLAASGLNTD
ncbi:MAG TPA: ribosomal RNA small subunit methyltransferase I, partial [Candidatus Eisenbacteria bacterium]|nr:ribosomal RNA small subunit methyltransferase I [Candidatus Eisenbacteria bacterium]